jgi:geranylgeranyl pyrophosphate synthase
MPLLLSLPRATPAERERVARVMREREFDSVAPSEILEIAERHGGLAETRSLARDYAGAARVALGSFPESEAKDGLLLATESVIDRVG